MQLLKQHWRTKIINGLAIAGLFIAFYIGQQNDHKEENLIHTHLLKDYKIDYLQNDEYGTCAYTEDSAAGYINTGIAQGYGGPMEVLVLTDNDAQIINIELLENSETLSYINKLKREGYFFQYKGKSINDLFSIRDDIDAVSGATISSNAIALACREASWNIAESVFSLSIPVIHQKWNFGFQQIIALIIFGLALANGFIKNKKLRYAILMASLVAFGFLFNSSISISHFGRVLLGYLPDIRTHFVWWLLLGGTILGIIIWGRNLYCTAICPFHAVQDLLNKVSGINLKISPKLNKLLLKTPAFLLWFSLVLILISKNSTISSYEPFSMMFSLEGMGIQWYILPAALFGSLLVNSFFCRFFCPVGAGFKVMLRTRKSIKSNLRKKHD